MVKTFQEAVKLHRKMYRLGTKIIQHKKIVNGIHENQLQDAFNQQERRIQKYYKMNKKMKRFQENHMGDMNAYWTGLS